MNQPDKLPDPPRPTGQLAAKFGLAEEQAEERKGVITGLLRPRDSSAAVRPVPAPSGTPPTSSVPEEPPAAEIPPVPPERQPEQVAHSAATPSVVAVVPESEGQVGGTEPPVRESTPRRRPAGEDPDPTRPTLFYVPLELRDRLRHAAVGASQLDVILDAIEQTESGGILWELVRAHQRPDTSGLFERKTPRGSEARVKINVRARPQHLQVLDDLAARYGSNRSELVRVALDHVLPAGSRRRR